MTLHSRKDIERISFDVLKQSKSLGVFPTPVSEILKHVELTLDTKSDLTKIPRNYRAHISESLKRALRKLNGALDRREKIIYLDLDQSASKKRFVTLHEIGHDVLPWQRRLFDYIEDDEKSIDPDTHDEFEAEASYFASSTLFQLDRYEEEMQKLPLEIKSPIYLSKMFGSSTHASLRRFVEYSNKRCALLVLKKPITTIVGKCVVRNYFQSATFTSEFGEIKWNNTLGIEWDFIKDYVSNRRLHTNGQICLVVNNTITTFQYHYFFNSYNAFVLIMPPGEKNRSRTNFII